MTAPTPHRVQLRRVKDYRRPAGTVQVDRATIFGNPFQVGNPGRWCWPLPDRAGWIQDMIYNHGPIDNAFAVYLFERWLMIGALPPLPQSLTRKGQGQLRAAMAARRALIIARLPSLRGHPLGCRCAPDQPCHADALLQLANITPGAA
jgi:Domain of unknown function (DUF4326)